MPMGTNEKTTALIPSVGVNEGRGQPFPDSTNHSIPDAPLRNGSKSAALCGRARRGSALCLSKKTHIKRTSKEVGKNSTSYFYKDDVSDSHHFTVNEQCRARLLGFLHYKTF